MSRRNSADAKRARRAEREAASDLILVDEIVKAAFPDIVAVIPAEPEPGTFFRLYFFRNPDFVTDVYAEHRAMAFYDAPSRELHIFEVEPGGEPVPITASGMNLSEVEEAGGFVICQGLPA